MTDNPSYRGSQGQGQPGDEYYDERTVARPKSPAARTPRPYPPQEQGGYPQQGESAYPPRPGYPTRAATPSRVATRPGRLPRPGLPAVVRAAPARRLRPALGRRIPEQGYRPGRPAGTAPPPGGQPGYGDYDYGRQPAPGRHDDGYGRGEPRPAYPDQGGYPEQGGYGGGQYGRQEYAQPDYRRYGEPAAGAATASRATASPRGRDYEYGGPAVSPRRLRRGYGQGGYPAPPARTSRCSSTTAAAAPTSCARAPT